MIRVTTPTVTIAGGAVLFLFLRLNSAKLTGWQKTAWKAGWRPPGRMDTLEIGVLSIDYHREILNNFLAARGRGTDKEPQD